MSKAKNILVGNGQDIGVLFVMYVMINLKGHRFEVYTLVSEIHYNVHVVMGIKNVFEIEGVISTRDSCLHFLNRSIHFFPKTDIHLKSREQRFIKIDVPFIDEMFGLAMIKLLDLKTGCTNTIKV